jgi:hypothetical protein
MISTVLYRRKAGRKRSSRTYIYFYFTPYRTASETALVLYLSRQSLLKRTSRAVPSIYGGLLYKYNTKKGLRLPSTALNLL